jgi:hypothetical protein
MGDYIINFDPMKPKFEEKISEIFLLILQRIHNAAPGRSESSNIEKPVVKTKDKLVLIP